MKKIIYGYIIISLFTGCSSITKNNLNSFNSENKAIQLTNNTKAPDADYFTVSEATAAALLGIPSLFMKKRGVIDVSHAENPAISIKKEVAKIISQKYNLKVIPAKEKIFNPEKPKNTREIFTKYTEGDLVLDVNSLTYGGYYPGRVNDFRTYYKATVSLIERKTKKSIYKSSYHQYC